MENYVYQVGGSLGKNHPTYVNRKADQELYDTLTAGKFCHVLDSRQFGKSSHSATVLAVAFSPNSQLIAICAMESKQRKSRVKKSSSKLIKNWQL